MKVTRCCNGAVRKVSVERDGGAARSMHQSPRIVHVQPVSKRRNFKNGSGTLPSVLFVHSIGGRIRHTQCAVHSRQVHQHGCELAARSDAGLSGIQTIRSQWSSTSDHGAAQCPAVGVVRKTSRLAFRIPSKTRIVVCVPPRVEVGSGH